jgi:6,7-dimethyl-8-ribityllumazine synthase
MARIGILAADFNKQIVEPMIDAVTKDAQSGELEAGPTVRVPGCYEIPLAADLMLGAADCAGLVVLGYIETGETLHGEVMGHVVHRALVDLSLEHGKPVGIGIIGPGASLPQAEARKIDYARAALRACLASLEVRDRLRT